MSRLHCFANIIAPNSHSLSALEVVGHVAKQHTLRGVDVPVADGLLEHARLRLAAAARAGEIRMVRTEVKSADVRAVLVLQPLVHHAVQAVHVLLGIIPLGDARLIRHDDHEISRLVEPADQLGDALDEHELLRLVQVAGVDVDCAVPVKKRGFSHFDAKSSCALA